ncbi:MAG: aminoacetone oxidase family FAD-binding enzyme [Clostridia bacterium]|nr:aminoacetone oxidase family FAD-binding enzyme [Clostridia bacterium]
MQKIFKTIIVGGGAAGLLAAVELLSGSDCLKGDEVLILERTDRVGKKLIATGNGQGNLTNVNIGDEYYYGDKNFIAQFIEQEKRIDLKKYFNGLSIPLGGGKDGRLYPLSKQASAVLDVIRAYLEFKGCTVVTGKKVTAIEKSADGFTVFHDKEKFTAKAVIMATGGKAGKQFGTDGTAYALAEKLGHKTTELYPSLVQIKTETESIKGLKGLKETACVTAFSGAKPLKSATGDLLFTEFGVSGSAAFTVSAAIAGLKDVYLIAEFLPDLSFSETEKILEDRMQKPYFKKEDLLCGVLNKRVGQAVIKAARSFTANDIAYAIKNFKLKIKGTLDFNYAQVTRGGIKTDKINPLNYESKLAKNLYIVGEALDVDGDCGGYNLTFAFVSGIIAAKDVKKKINKGVK